MGKGIKGSKCWTAPLFRLYHSGDPSSSVGGQGLMLFLYLPASQLLASTDTLELKLCVLLERGAGHSYCLTIRPRGRVE